MRQLSTLCGGLVQKGWLLVMKMRLRLERPLLCAVLRLQRVPGHCTLSSGRSWLWLLMAAASGQVCMHTQVVQSHPM